MKRRAFAAVASLALCATSLAVARAPLAAQSRDAGDWILPRTPDGRPDLQGSWTNATITPIQRPPSVGPTLTPQQVASIEGERQGFIDELAAPSDPDREAPPAGGTYTGNALFDAASGGSGGYNYFYIDAGDCVAVFNGEPRSSLITRPASGRLPGFTAEARARMAKQARINSQFGEYDNPENRPLSDRCMKSFGSNAGPPMLPNYFYNNNYTIVQTSDHVMIMTEMVHDVRIIRMGEHEPLPDHIRPWFGDSRGWWEGDTLIVETTHLQARQLNDHAYIYPGGSDQWTVVERFTRVGERELNYEFTVTDPGTYTEPWGGEIPFTTLDGQVYEYACHEGNYALSNILSGARAQERGGAGNRMARAGGRHPLDPARMVAAAPPKSASGFAHLDEARSVRIETPEHVRLGFELAGLGSRSAAVIADILLISIAAVSILLVGDRFAELTGAGWLANLGTSAGIFLGFGLQWGYFFISEGFFGGRTIGKKAMGVRVIGAGGTPISLPSAALRNLIRIVDLPARRVEHHRPGVHGAPSARPAPGGYRRRHRGGARPWHARDP